jgi:hypothetical protein
MKSLTQRGFHGNYSSKNSSYRNYSSFREAFDHPMYEHGFRSSVLGNVGPNARTVDNSGIICHTRVYPANATAKEEK